MARGYPSDIINARRSLPNWFGDAECRDAAVDTFFPEEGDAVQAQAAKRICYRCPIREQCLEYAVITNQRFGVWGATTPKERRKLRRQRLSA